ncbi:tyrosine-type recombinase/integrase [Knoellia sp. CPCC 206450]|uniref:tyrosine-type recombinase/integrase n=1 Tax=Knoellia tibetensis TaxID=3404798 RepID=UPI003B42EB87
MTTRRRLNGEGSFYRTKNGGYRAYVWVTLPDGRRRRKYVYGRTREDVQAKWTALQERARRGPVVPKSPTVESYMTTWLDNVVRPGLAPSTTQAYEMCLRLYIAPLIGTRRLDRLTVIDVQGWVNRLRRTCQCCSQGKDARRAKPECCAMGNCCGQLPSDSTVHQAWRVLRAALSAAQRDELVHRNVASLVRMPMPRSSRAKIWTAAEAARFLQSASTDHDPLYAAYVLLLVLGLRRGEVLGLGWDDIDLDTGQARISWQLQRVGHQLRRTRTKTRSSDAVLPLPDVCAQALRRRREEQTSGAKTAGEAWHESGLVFTSSLGTPMDPRNFHRDFKNRAAAANVPEIPVHSTRRTCASLLVELDVHPRVTMQILRHSQIAVTMNIYAQVAPASTRAALAKLGEAFLPTSTPDDDPALLQNTAASNSQRPFPELEIGF